MYFCIVSSPVQLSAVADSWHGNIPPSPTATSIPFLLTRNPQFLRRCTNVEQHSESTASSFLCLLLLLPEKNYYLFRVVGLVCSLYYATYTFTFPSCLLLHRSFVPFIVEPCSSFCNSFCALTFITLHGPTRDKMILLAIVDRCRRRSPQKTSGKKWGLKIYAV